MYNEIIRIAQEMHPAELASLTYIGAVTLGEVGLISPGAVAEIKEAAGSDVLDAIIINDESSEHDDDVHIYYRVDMMTWGVTGYKTMWYKDLASAQEAARDPYAGAVVEHIISDAFDVEDIESIIRTQKDIYEW